MFREVARGHNPGAMCSKLAAALTAALALTGAALAGSDLGPVLRIDANHALRGSHFKAHELLRVVIVADSRQVRQVRTTAAGSFALLPAPADSCSGTSLLIRATGTSGDAAAIRLPQGLCPPPSAYGAASADKLPPQTDGVPPNADGIPSRNLG